MGSEARARLGLAALLAASLLSFGQLFEHDDYVGPSLLGMLLATGLAMLCRRLGSGAPTTLAVSALGLVAYVLLVFEAGATLYGLPTLEAARGVVRAVGRSVELANLDFAPVPVRPGYVVLTVIGMWSIAAIGEVATFRLRRPVLASLGPIGLFSFVLIVGRGRADGLLVTIFLTGLLTYWGLESAHRLRSWGRWVTAWASHDDPEGESVTGRVARRMGVTCVAAALVAPLLLPALGSGLLAWRTPVGEGPGNGSGGGVGNSVNPFVQLKPTLLKQSDEVFFTVTSNIPSYWRLLSLARFDGNQWYPVEGSTLPLDGGLIGNDPPFTVPTDTLEQTFDLSDLAGDYLPAAERPDEIDFDDSADAPRVESDASKALQVDAGEVTGMRYTVRSELPQLSFKKLRRAEVAPATQLDSAYLELGPDIPPQLETIARDWTSSATSDFDKLVAIQSRFQSGEFTYSERVPPDDDGNFLLQFLTSSKAGYCQQFATAFALLARELGYPTRVSVGFLPGNPSDQPLQGPVTYTVRGTHAHAWPEVYFQGYGWVPFEPTPRVGDTSEPTFTIPPSERTPNTGAGAGGFLEDPRTFREGVQTQPSCRGLQGLQALDCAANQPIPGAGTLAVPRGRDDYAWERTFAALARVLGVALALFLAGVPLLKALRIRRRYRRARGPSATVAAAFAHFRDDASELSLDRSRAESAMHYVGRLRAAGHVPDQAAQRLARLYNAAEYSSAGATEPQAAEAVRLAKALRRSMWAKTSWWHRARRLFSPASLRPTLSLGARLRPVGARLANRA